MQPKPAIILILAICLCHAGWTQDNLSPMDTVINFNAFLRSRIAGDSLVTGRSGAYIPGMDSIKTSLFFIEQNSSLLSSSKVAKQRTQPVKFTVGYNF